MALLFGLSWLSLALLGGFVVFPVWNSINIGLCGLAVLVCATNYVNEYLGKFPLSYR